eukprot:2405629-Pyramimonas_sp.AAC.1
MASKTALPRNSKQKCLQVREDCALSSRSQFCRDRGFESRSHWMAAIFSGCHAGRRCRAALTHDARVLRTGQTAQ